MSLFLVTHWWFYNSVHLSGMLVIDRITCGSELARMMGGDGPHRLCTGYSVVNFHLRLGNLCVTCML